MYPRLVLKKIYKIRKLAVLLKWKLWYGCWLVYKHSPDLREELDLAKNIIPDRYRVCGTCFTTLALVGDSSDGFVHIHKDKRDVVLMILSLDENNVIGGDTVCDKMR